MRFREDIEMIEITEPAADKIKEYFATGLPEEGSSLRIKVVGGGCSGLRYELAFDKNINNAYPGGQFSCRPPNKCK